MGSHLILYAIFFGSLCHQTVSGLFDSCNHKIQLLANQKVYINSPYYPAEYPYGTSCRYTVEAPLDHELNFKCNVQLNSQSTSSPCQNEVFYFNSEGSEVLTESNYFCGNEHFERSSFLNRAVISYISQPYYKSTSQVNQHLKNKLESQGNFGATTSTTTTTTTTTKIPTRETPKIPSLPENDEIANAFAYITDLLIKNASEIVTPTSSEMLTSDPDEIFGTLPSIFWRTDHTDHIEPKSLKSSNLSRITTSTLNSGGVPYPGYVNNRGGGRFSCLVEVVQPPCDCGWSVSLKIAGPTGVAGVNEFPSMAGVRTVRSRKMFCGATIIHHRYLLSAAHCFTSEETNRSELINVVVGENDLSTVLESYYTRTYEIEEIIPHENFYSSSRSLRNDIAILRTRIPIEWSRGVGPACLPLTPINDSSSDIPRRPPINGQTLDTAGWGTTAFGGAQSTQLLKTRLDVFATSECRQILRSVPPGVFCTYTPGSDTCQYDSGGGLYWRSDRLIAVGIVSYGFACAAEQPSVNTRIASFVKWIKTKTPEVSYCVK